MNALEHPVAENDQKHQGIGDNQSKLNGDVVGKYKLNKARNQSVESGKKQTIIDKIAEPPTTPIPVPNGRIRENFHNASILKPTDGVSQYPETGKLK